jgi:uncharacterized protein (TIGR02391 family)
MYFSIDHFVPKLLDTRSLFFNGICRSDLISDNHFSLVFAAAKIIIDKIQNKTGLTEDGISLVDSALGLENPILAVNSLTSEAERLEQTVLINLTKAFFSMFKLTTADEPLIKWSIDEQDALDLLTSISYIHRQLDKAIVTK